MGFGGVDGILRVYTADSTSFIFLRGPLVDEEVKETMDAYGLGIGNRDIYEREWPSANQ